MDSKRLDSGMLRLARAGDPFDFYARENNFWKEVIGNPCVSGLGVYSILYIEALQYMLNDAQWEMKASDSDRESLRQLHSQAADRAVRAESTLTAANEEVERLREDAVVAQVYQDQTAAIAAHLDEYHNNVHADRACQAFVMIQWIRETLGMNEPE